MRIQGISQTGVPGAEQISLGAISSAAQAKMKTTQALTKVVGDYEAKVQKAEQEAEMHSATIGLEKDTQALMQSIESSNAYDDDGFQVPLLVVWQWFGVCSVRVPLGNTQGRPLRACVC